MSRTCVYDRGKERKVAKSCVLLVRRENIKHIVAERHLEACTSLVLYICPSGTKLFLLPLLGKIIVEVCNKVKREAEEYCVYPFYYFLSKRF